MRLPFVVLPLVRGFLGYFISYTVGSVSFPPSNVFTLLVFGVGWVKTHLVTQTVSGIADPIPIVDESVFLLQATFAVPLILYKLSYVHNMAVHTLSFLRKRVFSCRS